MIVTGESEGIFNEATVDYFKVIQHICVRTVVNHEKSQLIQPTSDLSFWTVVSEMRNSNVK